MDLGRIPNSVQEAADWAKVLGPIAAGLYGSWRYVVKPRVVLPISALYTRVSTGLDHVETMSKALGENGGASLADAIHRQERAQTVQGRALISLQALVGATVDMLEKPIFQTDEAGRFTRVNRAFELTFGYRIADVLGFGWVTAIDPKDRSRVMQELEFAVKDRRAFKTDTKWLTRAGDTLVVTMAAHPTLGSPETDLIGWLGSIDIIVAPKGPAQGAA